MAIPLLQRYHPNGCALVCCLCSFSYRDIEELMRERGVPVDHATIQRWVVKIAPLLSEAFKKRKAATNGSWRIDETYIKIKGQWYYQYRAVDKYGRFCCKVFEKSSFNFIDFFRTFPQIDNTVLWRWYW